ncbi:tyrosine-type recombinase/integrase [Niallia taxi]|uniref:tyrosine-type recombinase/integrase n=1 Tax=Niallia taxi TaxID=2499688 RepID=UPI0039825F8C
MKTVHPIRDKIIIENMKVYLKKRNERDYVLFVAGINTGLRIGDLLELKVGNVRGEEIELVEMKTGKPKIIPINSALRRALNPFIKGKADNDYLFLSRQNDHKGVRKHINRSTAYRIIRKAAIECGFRKSCGTHTMRKTFGYMHYKKNGNIAALQKIFNHDKELTTYIYIGLEKDYLDKTYMDLNL